MEEKEKDFLLQELKQYKEIYEESKLILDSTVDFISIADDKGVFLRISKGAEENFGVSDDEILGQSAYLLEKKGIIDKSMTVVVIESKQKEFSIQRTRTGKIFMVTGIPMFDEVGNLKKAINISRDITEVEKLNHRLKETEELLDWYREELHRKQELQENFIIGENPIMKKVLNLIKQVSTVDATVLLQGETGVGKSLIAKTIHKMSHRREKPFIQVNCGAITESLLESELFGYSEGAFTGALREGKKGFFEIANKGTLFLDEIAEIPLHLQVKLLHALEEQEIYKVGGSTPINIDIRILVATNKDLRQMVKEGKFREDLYYRLNVLPVYIPPLRERVEDIPILTHFFLKKYNEKYCTNKKLTLESHNTLTSHFWQGNIRELENAIERLVITCDKDYIESEYIYHNLFNIKEEPNIEVRGIIPLKEATKEVERQLLLKAFKKYKTTRKISEILEVDQSTVAKKLKIIKEQKR
ncbi:PAS domain S-box-containing protein [Anaerovirgula multivorans]|uniref:HTH-type transcriptional regulatory protein TyrR n=1 Tax=Anaerovirgula multivorans TaxID=312168 RepID=A0A239J6E9_9FIRM|nr:sigma 54-interacting transcriptional regulator [Anaerovirgula multivorans]SNT01616.1 PAS domain S-box-containing protein [Anaerovirgula multivorans]